MEWVLDTKWSVCDTRVNNVCLPQASLSLPLIPRQEYNKVSTTLTACCQNGNILYIENTQRCDILPLCFTPIMKIFLILIQDQGLSSIFVIVIFWL